MSKFDTAAQYWQEVTDKLMHSKEEYANFLKFSSGIYKHDFTDAAMIYRQNPHAAKVAELEMWNKLGRRVNRGEHSIVSFGNGGRCKYLFDVSQTNGRKAPELWKLNTKLSERLLSAVNEKNSTGWKDLNEAVSKIALDSMKQTMSMGYYPDFYEKLSSEDRKKFNRTVLSSARYIASNRCQLGGEIKLDTTLNLEGLDLCTSRNDFAKFASLAHSTAKSVLLYVEQELLEVIKKIKQEQLEAPAPVSEESQNESVREIPFTTGDIFDMEGRLYKVDEIDIVNDNVRLSEISTNQTKSMSVTELSFFFTDEQKKERAIDSAIENLLQGEPEVIIENSPVILSPEIPSLTDENIISEIIKRGERYERNEDIRDFFAENDDMDFRAGYISSIYREGAVQLDINGIGYGFEKTENGLAVWQGTSENREKQSTLSWDSVQAVIADSIDKGIFVDTPEKEKEKLSRIGDEGISDFFSEDVTELETEQVPENVRNIRCETKEEAEQLFDYLRDNEYTWYDGEELTVTDWFYAENNTVYSIDKDAQTVYRKDMSAYSYEQLRSMDIEDYTNVKDEFVSGSNFREPDFAAEKKYDLNYIHGRSEVNVYDFSEGTDSKPIAVIDSGRNVTLNTELPKSVIENIYEYADNMADIYVLPEIRKPLDNEPTVTITFSETPSPFYSGLTMPFSQADGIFGEADKNYTESRNNVYSASSFAGYSKVDFTVRGGSDNPDLEYYGCYDLGDGDNGLLNHIKNRLKYLQSDKNGLAGYVTYLEKSLSSTEQLENPEPVKEIWSAYTQYIDDVRIAQIGRKIDDSKPLYGGNVQYCSGIFSDDNEQGFNVDFARELAEQLNKKGISDLKEATEFVNSEIAARDDFSDIKTDKSEEKTVPENQEKYDVRITRAENIGRGVSSYISSDGSALGDGYTLGRYNSYNEASLALAALREELNDPKKSEEYFNLCPYREREIGRGFEISIDGTDYQVYEIDRDNNTVGLAKTEDIDNTISYIMRNESNKPPVRTESFDYVSSLVNEKSVTAPKIGKSADELVVGDIIRYGDITGKIDSINDTTLTVQTGTHPALGKTYEGIVFWQDKFEKDGFEYLGHEEPERKESVAPKKSSRKKEVIPDDGQLDLFSVDYSGEPVKPIEYPQNVIDDFLRYGGYDSLSTERIIAEYRKNKTASENAEFLKEEFKDLSCGIISDGSHYSMSADSEGIYINSGESAYGSTAQFVAWEKAAERIGELLDSGSYVSQKLIDNAEEYSLYEAAEQICFIQRELDEEHIDNFFIDKEVFNAGFPEKTERVAEILRKSENLPAFTKAAEKLAAECRENKEIIPNAYDREKALKLPDMLRDLQRTPKVFTAAPDFKPAVHSFISDDELSNHLMKGYNMSVVKGGIYDYFTEGHTAAEKARHMKEHYGQSGSYSRKLHISSSGKGLAIERSNPLGESPQKLFSWKTVADVIDKAIKNGTYLSEKERAAYVKYAKDILDNTDRLGEYGKGYIERLKGIVEKHGGADVQDVQPETKPESEKNIFTVNSAVKSNYEGMVALVGADDKVYLGKSENYDSMGNYDNSDNSLLYISDNDNMFHFISLGAGWVKSQQEMLDNGVFTLEDYREFTRLSQTVLAKYNRIHEVDMGGEKFKPVSDKTVLTAPEKGENYRFSESDVVKGGQKAKYRANVEAIKTLLTLEKENRAATPEEQSVMAKYSGWGGIPQAFDRHNENWTEEYNELRKLLSGSEYSAARASSTTSFYFRMFLRKRFSVTCRKNVTVQCPQSMKPNSRSLKTNLSGVIRLSMLLRTQAEMLRTSYILFPNTRR